MEFQQASTHTLLPNYRSDCRDFLKFDHLTEFEAKLADRLCSASTMTSYARYKANQYSDELRALQIAYLVLSAIILISLVAFMMYRLFTCFKQKKSQEQIRL